MWVKLLRDKQFMKLDAEIKWAWVGMLLLAGDGYTPGKIGLSDEMGYSPDQIAHLIGVEPKTVSKTISAMGCNSLTIDSKGIITIVKWEEYQSEYQRQSKYREGYKSRLQSKVTSQGTPTEGEGEVDVRSKKEKDLKHTDMMCILDFFNLTLKKSLTLTPDRKDVINKCLAQGRTVEQIKQAIVNFSKDDWTERHKFCDLLYAIGRQRGKPDAFDKWFDMKSKSSNPEFERIERLQSELDAKERRIK